MRRAPAGRTTALEFGAAMDRAIRTLYAEGWDVAKAHAAFEANYKDDPADTKRTVAVAKLIIDRYALAYREQNLRIVDQGFAFVLDVPGMDVEIVGEIDRVVEQAGRIMPSEFKTTSQLTADYMKVFWWDVQTALYLIAARQMIQPTPTAVHIDAVLVAKSDPSKLRSAPLLRDVIEHDTEKLAYMVTRIKQIVGEIVTARGLWERGENDVWYENDKACMDYGGCRYLGLCRHAPSVRAQVLAQDYVEIVRDEADFAKFKDCRRGVLDLVEVGA